MSTTRIDGRSFNDSDWRIQRVANAKFAGDEHRLMTNHGGAFDGNHYVCEDCLTVYFDSNAKVEELPDVELVKSKLSIDEKFIETLLDLAFEHGEDLSVLRFIDVVAEKYGVQLNPEELRKRRSEREAKGREEEDHV